MGRYVDRRNLHDSEFKEEMSRLMPRPLLVVDTETTGQDPFAHEVLSVGLVALDSSDSVELHVELPAGAGWTDFGYDNFRRFEDDWRSGARPALEVVRSIESFIRHVFGGVKINLVGHNMAFDRFFLAKLAYRAGVESIAGVSHRTVDTFSLLMALHLSGRIPIDATTSSGAFEYFGISVPEKVRHTALGDAIATKQLFLRVLQMMEEK